jgi:DNA topoisomerase-2
VTLRCRSRLAEPQLSQREHVLVRPDTYIGSIEAITAPMWVFDTATSMMVNR